MQYSCLLKVALHADLIKTKKGITWDTSNRYYSIGLKLTELITQTLKCQYTISYPEDGEFGRRLANGTWTGMVEMVRRGEVDLAVTELGMTEERAEVVNFSYPFALTDVTFITEKPYFMYDLWTILEPFAWEVWLCFALCHAIMPPIFYFLLQVKCSFSKVVLDTFATFLGEPVFARSQKLPERTAIIVWFLGMMIMSYTYRANLLSILTFPTLEGVRIIPDLALEIRNGNYRSTTYSGSYYADSMLKSNDTNWRIIGEDLHKSSGTADIEEALQNDGNKKFAFIGPKPDFAHLVNSYYVSEDSFFTEMPAIAMKRDFWGKGEVNEVIHRIFAGGLYTKILSDEEFFKILRYSKFESEDDDTVKPLSLTHVYCAFYVLIFGYILATACFLMEILVARNHRKKRQCFVSVTAKHDFLKRQSHK